MPPFTCDHPFQAGDLVRCVNTAGVRAGNLAVAAIYTVTEVVTSRGEPMLRLAGCPQPFFAARFRLLARFVNDNSALSARRAVRMAEMMRDRAAVNGACTETDLLCAGFTRAEIATHAEAARAIAGLPGEVG